ncbi:MAG: DNA-formamidopyrimidine glycosylase family protein [Acidimicrobiales bacterium]
MPELAEVEYYRRLAETAALDRPVERVVALDAWYLKGGTSASALECALVGRDLVAARRVGKLLLLETSSQGPILGLRFGMTGRLLVDGSAGVEHLFYGGAGPGEGRGWDRFSLVFVDGGSLVMRDPRRLGGVMLDPPDRLGPDALAVSRRQLAQALVGSAAALKACLLDQSRLAGVGNLAADEALWRAGLSPIRAAGGLAETELDHLHRHLTATLAALLAGGGSHTGALMAHRRPGGLCPMDGTALLRGRVGGRTTWWCPRHQR